MVSTAAGDRECHLITPEFPPRIGGVADFTRAVAVGLAARGTGVHVWAPAPAEGPPPLTVQALASGFAVTALPRLSAAIDAHAPPRHLLVQWVPHGYGYKALNLPFCGWIWNRARRGDVVHLVVHEPFLPFDPVRLRQNVGAVVHSVMLAILLRAATTAWVSTPSFEPMIRRFGPKRLQYRWLPVPSPVARSASAEVVEVCRRQLAGRRAIGYFGTANPLVFERQRDMFRALIARRPDVQIVLIGRDSERLASPGPGGDPLPTDRVLALGERDAAEISAWVQCCDVFVQLYPDGLSARRTTAMALLEHGAVMVTSSGARTEAFWGDAVVLTPQNADGAIVDEALALLDDPGRRALVSRAAMSLYRERFHIDHTVDLLAAAINA